MKERLGSNRVAPERVTGSGADDPKATDDTPPFRTGWPLLYGLVLGFLIVQIIVYTWFTVAWR